jgi:hypothetical protein
MPKIQVKKAFVFFEGTRNCQAFSVITDSKIQAFQTSVSAQPIRDSKTIDLTTIAYKDL